MRTSLLLLTALSLVACQDDEAPSPAGDASVPLGQDDAAVNPGLGNDGGTPPATALDGAVQSQGLPCTVKAAVDAKCGSCHADVPQFGAPMALTSWDDFQAVSPRANKPIFQLAAERMTRTGEGMMPPSNAPQLSADERRALDAWLERGAPTSNDSCDAADAGAGGDASVDAGPPVDCELGFELRAGAGAGFPVPLSDDHYECFYFKSELDAKALVTSLSPLIDDSRVLHHWLLFGASQEEAPSGTHRQCNGIHPNAYIMAAWAPGTPALELPPDVGMEVPSGPRAQFILETHYNNIQRLPNVVDKSGVKVCATAKPKGTLAAIHWLGSELIYLQPRMAGSASSTCTPSGSDPIHLLGVMPHMHTLGKSVKMTILRKNGSTETFHEGPFEFSNQTWYKKDVVLQPGDRMQSSCSFMNTTDRLVTLGESTAHEMCYLFTLAYPVGRMNTGGDYRDVFGQPYVRGPNKCMR